MIKHFLIVVDVTPQPRPKKVQLFRGCIQRETWGMRPYAEAVAEFIDPLPGEIKPAKSGVKGEYESYPSLTPL
jgi:hypothetical protein